MWTIIKFEKKKLSSLKSDLEKKLGANCKFYVPKLLFKKIHKKQMGKKRI